MQRYVAFLRGINVGGRVVKMEVLKRIFEQIKLDNVSTFIASGNVLFDAPKSGLDGLETRIEKALEADLGIKLSVFVRTDADICRIAEEDPFLGETDEGHTMHVLFLKSSLSDEEEKQVLELNGGEDLLAPDGREVYWRSGIRSSDSPIFKKNLLDKAIRSPITARNINTVRRLAEKFKL